MNNGNVAGFAATGQQNFNRSYTYDSLNRFQTMSAPGDVCSGLQWTIDAWGNRTAQTATSGSCYSPQVSVDGNNRLVGSPYQYDAAGNLLSDGNHTYTYDAENRITQVDGGATATYVYDGLGQRVEKISPGSDEEYLYDIGGRINTVFHNDFFERMYVYLNGKQLAEYFNNTTYFPMTDQLGSTRLLTGVDGSVQESDDYYPYGEPITAGTESLLKFTGKERDSESGLDNFGARYDSSAFGRFMTPDPDTATPLHIVNPQRWNMYAYVVDNPTNYIDPDGEDAIAVNFVNEVPFGGHEGVIVVHADGSATYARFGPQHPGKSADAGKVTETHLKPIKFGSNGLPTDASYKQLAKEVAALEGENPSSVGFNYFKTSEADSIALDNWMREWEAHHAPYYDVTSQNCATFCIAGLIQGHAIENKNISIIPNRLFTLLSGLATENWTWQGRTLKEKVTHKICSVDVFNEKHCQ